jgi:hypothetical protein
MGADDQDFRRGNAALRLDDYVDIANRLAVGNVTLPVDGVAIGFERRFDVLGGFFELIIVFNVVLARRDRLDVLPELRRKCALLVREWWKRTTVRRARHAGHVKEGAVPGRDEYQEQDERGQKD